MRSVIFLLCFVAVGNVGAEEVMFTSQGTAPGTYYYAFDVAADGSITIRQVQSVQINGNGQPPVPNPPPPDDISAKVKQWALEVNDPQRSQTARAIAVVYLQVARSAEQGDVASVDQMQTLTDSLYTTAMRLVNKTELWAGWKANVDTLTPDTVPQAIDVWQEIAEGLQQASNVSTEKVYLRPPRRHDRIQKIYNQMLREASCEISNQHGLF